ncbi:hypothetical protein ACZ90_47440 [Streptomyces albus subsp. albus]|nr:hypothetical protein ACZ90_47440 [Streptomyces albus subsp. albus]
MDFVNAVLDAVVAIAGGGAAGVPKMIEGALAASIPLLIGFLASLLGIGNLAAKVKSVFHAVARPVNRAIDKIVDFIAKMGKKLWAKLKGKTGKGGKKSEEMSRKIRLEKAVRDARRAMRAKSASIDTIRAEFAKIAQRYQLSGLDLVKDGDHRYHPVAKINPTLPGPAGVLFSGAELQELDRLAATFAGQIKEKGREDAFRANPKRFLTPGPDGKIKVDIGQAVEVSGTPGLKEIAKEGNLTLLHSVYLEYRDDGNRVVGGKGPELDFLLLGHNSIEKVVSSKLSPKQFKMKRDRALLAHFYEIPTASPELNEYLRRNFGGSPVFGKARSVNVVHDGGGMPIAEFRLRYLSKKPVDQVDIVPLTPGPESDRGLQLRATSSELIDKLADLILGKL